MCKIQIVLPARLASTRLPEKLLRKVGGKSVLQHTYIAASKAQCAADRGVIVAVDDSRLAAEVDSFGGRWVMTPRDCPSGTDRIARVAEEIRDADIFVNVQGDEPEIDPAAIDAVATAIRSDSGADMATAGTPLRSLHALSDPNVVKIVMGESGAGQGRAVYFSRAAVPFDRDGTSAERLAADPPVYWHHIGLYAFRRDFLAWFAAAAPSVLETVERLEQLRAVAAAKRIVVAQIGAAMPGIDTESDLDAFRRRVENAD